MTVSIAYEDFGGPLRWRATVSDGRRSVVSWCGSRAEALRESRRMMAKLAEAAP